MLVLLNFRWTVGSRGRLRQSRSHRVEDLLRAPIYANKTSHACSEQIDENCLQNFPLCPWIGRILEVLCFSAGNARAELKSERVRLLHARCDRQDRRRVGGGAVVVQQGSHRLRERNRVSILPLRDWIRQAWGVYIRDRYLVHIGRVYFLMGNHTLAVENLERAVKSNPNDSVSEPLFWCLLHIPSSRELDTFQIKLSTLQS